MASCKNDFLCTLGYHGGKPIESVFCCFYKLTLSKTENVSVFYEFTGTINHRFLTNQNGRSILVILIKSNIPSNPWYIARIQLFRERLSEKLHAAVPIGIVGGFDFIVLERNLKEWYERPWTCVCECWVHCSSKKFERMARGAMDTSLRVLKESNKRSFDSYSVRKSVVIISHITFQACRGQFFFRQPFSKELYSKYGKRPLVTKN